jgi:hypothetical protein
MKSDLVACGSTQHVPAGCKELHIPSFPYDECPECRKKTRDTWRQQKAIEEAAEKTQKKTLTATA